MSEGNPVCPALSVSKLLDSSTCWVFTVVMVPLMARFPPIVTSPAVVIVVTPSVPMVALLNDAFEPIRVGAVTFEVVKLLIVALVAVTVVRAEVVAVRLGVESTEIVAFEVLRLLATNVVTVARGAVRLELTMTLLVAIVELDRALTKATGNVAD